MDQDQELDYDMDQPSLGNDSHHEEYPYNAIVDTNSTLFEDLFPTTGVSHLGMVPPIPNVVQISGTPTSTTGATISTLGMPRARNPIPRVTPPIRDTPLEPPLTMQEPDPEAMKRFRAMRWTEENWGIPGWKAKWDIIKDEVPEELRTAMESVMATQFQTARKYAAEAHAKRQNAWDINNVIIGENKLLQRKAKPSLNLFHDRQQKRAYASGSTRQCLPTSNTCVQQRPCLHRLCSI